MSKYKDTLNLPRTNFQFNTVKTGAIHKLESDILEKWEKNWEPSNISKKCFFVCDGPPFANGDIHLGHVINKVIKDVTMRAAQLKGFETPFQPGWDCHGLPIENKVIEESGVKDTVELRKSCSIEAGKWVDIQREQFKKLGIKADWNNPYRTMDPNYEANVINVFAKLVEKELIYRQLRPVNWSVENKTALAEAEIEYKKVTEESAYVAFNGTITGFKYLVWTTTPWTLPANMAIAYNPKIQYSEVLMNSNNYVCATSRVADVFKGCEYKILKTLSGEELFFHIELYKGLLTGKNHSFKPADFVTETSGTGLVHIAPGHGDDDYRLGIKYQMDIYCPVQANCCYDDTVISELRGVHVWKANKLILDLLKQNGNLFKTEPCVHDYPHDERSGKPTITRATAQWFVALDKPYDNGLSLRERAINSLDKVNFYPESGRERLLSMLKNRPDWCISRQRYWGIPIPIFYDNGEPDLHPYLIRKIASYFNKFGSSSWYTELPSKLTDGHLDDIGPEKETDIFDVWFESGCVWTTAFNGQSDVYIEGSDQHRGWFQHSLLLSVAVNNQAPFKEVVTHGFIVGLDGKKLSKRDKNYVKAIEQMALYGAEPLRVWACSVDFTEDMKVGPKVISEFVPKYDKIRNVVRFLLSNLYDFSSKDNYLEPLDCSLDNMILCKLEDVAKDVMDNYENYKYHLAFSSLYLFCNNDLSAFYGNVVKDRLYCEHLDSPLRRRTQSTMYKILVNLVRLLEPMMPFTAQEIWDLIGKDNFSYKIVRDNQTFKLLMDLRDDALIQLEHLKRNANLTKATESEAHYIMCHETAAKISPYGIDLADLVGAGSYSIEINDFSLAIGSKPVVKIIDRRDSYGICQRSWRRCPTVGKDEKYPDLCQRDANVIKLLEKN